MYATPFKPLLGELLVELGTIRRDQLSRASAEQRRGEERLGETLIRLGMVRLEDLAGALREQRKRWVAASFGAVMMAIHPFAVFARSTSSQMRVSVTVENSAVVNTQLRSGTLN